MARAKWSRAQAPWDSRSRFCATSGRRDGSGIVPQDAHVLEHQDIVEVLPVGNRGDLSRFIDYAYARNRHDPHWIPPLRISERERLTPKTNPFFANAAAE